MRKNSWFPVKHGERVEWRIVNAWNHKQAFFNDLSLRCKWCGKCACPHGSCTCSIITTAIISKKKKKIQITSVLQRFSIFQKARTTPSLNLIARVFYECLKINIIIKKVLRSYLIYIYFSLFLFTVKCIHFSCVYHFNPTYYYYESFCIYLIYWLFNILFLFNSCIYLYVFLFVY